MNAHAPDTLPDRLTEHVLRRICGEFLEMPGLRLTRRQAQRLWGLDEETCAQALEYLVETRFLARRGPELYARLIEGAMPFPPPRMAKAVLDQPPSTSQTPVGRRVARSS